MSNCECNPTTQCCETASATATPAAPTDARPAGPFYQPRADIWEAGDEFLLQLDLPGAKTEQIELNYEQGVLTLTAPVTPRQPQATTWLRREYGAGGYQRSFRLGEEIDAAVHEIGQHRDALLAQYTALSMKYPHPTDMH